MTYAIDFAPQVPLALIWAFAIAAAVFVIFAALARAAGAWARAIAFAVALAALANPLIIRETREGLPDVVALIVDHSSSMDIRHRRADADAAASRIREMLSADK